jgi:hypothetical protein
MPVTQALVANKRRQQSSGDVKSFDPATKARNDAMEAKIEDASFKNFISKAEIKAAMIKYFDRNLDTITTQLRDQRVYWVRCEFFYTFFSLLGLAIFIFNYEWDLYYNGFKGISSLTGSSVTEAEAAAAIAEKLAVPYTYHIKILGCITTLIAIIFLFMYKIAHINWKNRYYNKCVLRETLNSSQHDYVSLDHKKSKHSGLVKVERRRSIAVGAARELLDSSFREEVQSET